MLRQREVGLHGLERSVSEEIVHFVHGGNDAVRANHLDCARSLKPRDANGAVVDKEAVGVAQGVASLLFVLSGR